MISRRRSEEPFFLVLCSAMRYFRYFDRYLEMALTLPTACDYSINYSVRVKIFRSSGWCARSVASGDLWCSQDL